MKKDTGKIALEILKIFHNYILPDFYHVQKRVCYIESCVQRGTYTLYAGQGKAARL